MKREWWWLVGGVLGGVVLGWSVAEIRPTPSTGASRASEAVPGTELPATQARASDVLVLPVGPWNPGAEPPPTPGDVGAIRASIEAYLAEGENGNRYEALRQLQRWSGVDPREALRFVAEAPRFPWRAQAMGVPLAAIAREDLVASIDWMREHIPPEQRDDAVGAMIEELGDVPQVALEVGRLCSDTCSIWDLRGPLQKLVETDSAAAAQWFDRVSPEFRVILEDSLVVAWFASDPDGAIRWCHDREDGSAATARKRALLSAAAHAGAEPVRRVIEAMQLGPEQLSTLGLDMYGCEIDAGLILLPYLQGYARDDMLQRALGEEMQADPSEALRAVTAIEDPRMTELALSALKRWQESDFVAAAAWEQSLTDPALRGLVEDLRQRERAMTDPAGYLAAMEGGEDAGPKGVHADMALNMLSLRDPAAAAGWAERHWDQVAPITAGSLVGRWLATDEEAALAWMEKLPASPARDAALENLAIRCAAAGEFDRIETVIAGMADPVGQAAARWKVITRMAVRNPAAVVRWVEQEPMAEDVRTVWLGLIRSRAFEGEHLD